MESSVSWEKNLISSVPWDFEDESYFDSKTSKLNHIRSETLLPDFMTLVIKSTH